MTQHRIVVMDPERRVRIEAFGRISPETFPSIKSALEEIARLLKAGGVVSLQAETVGSRRAKT